jgi:hypothetical protein
MPCSLPWPLVSILFFSVAFWSYQACLGVLAASIVCSLLSDCRLSLSVLRLHSLMFSYLARTVDFLSRQFSVMAVHGSSQIQLCFSREYLPLARRRSRLPARPSTSRKLWLASITLLIANTIQLGYCQCLFCLSGRYCLGGSCTTCTRGYYCPGGINPPQTPCQAGRYGASTGLTSSSSCTTCPTGNYCAAGSTALVRFVSL